MFAWSSKPNDDVNITLWSLAISGDVNDVNTVNKGLVEILPDFYRVDKVDAGGQMCLLDNTIVKTLLDGRCFVTNGSGIVVKCCWTKKSIQNRKFWIVLRHFGTFWEDLTVR